MHYTFRIERDGAMSMERVGGNVESMWGIPAHQALRDVQLLIDHVLPADLSAFYRSIELSRRSLQPWQHEFRIRARDGYVKWIFGSSHPSVTADGATVWRGVLHELPPLDAEPSPEREDVLRRLAVQQQAVLRLEVHPDFAHGDPVAAARALNEVASRSMDVERVGVWLADEDGGALCCTDLYVRSAVAHGGGLAFEPTASQAFLAALREDPLLAVGDVRRDARVRPFLECYYEPHAVVSVLHVALLVDGRVRGVLSCEQVGRPRVWSGQDMQFLSMLADQYAQLLVAAERRATAADLRLRERAMDASLNGILIADARVFGTPIVYANDGLLRVTGRAAEDVLESPLAALYTDVPGVVPEEGSLCVVWEHYDGERAWAELTLSPVHDEAGLPSHFIVIVNDVTRHKQFQDALVWHAHYDPLTDLPNRRLCVERLDGYLAAGVSPVCGAVLSLDLDGFHTVNEGLGREMGNVVLLAARDRLHRVLQSQERPCAGTLLARAGGDNFIVLAFGIDSAEGAQALARRLAEALAEPLPLRGRTLSLTASCGISLFPGDGRVGDRLIGASEAALMAAKRLGRGATAFFDAAANEASRERLELDSDMRAGLAQGEFYVVYQLQVDAGRDQIIGVEALLRWQHPSRGEVPPAVFIPLAEDSGFILALGEWVLEQACAQSAAWRTRGLDLRVAVNLSPRQIQQPDLLDRVRRSLARHSVPPGRLELEITENALMHNLQEASDLLSGLKDMGVHVSIDDFGTGYSSLRYLKALPLDALKIDKSFVDDVPGDPQAAAIVDAVIAMARSLGLEVIAEGVESAEQVAHLRGAGCDRMQGYFFSRPLKPAAVFARLRSDVTAH